MADGGQPQPREVWLAEVAGVETEKDRRSVVVVVDHERAVVVYGQGSPGPAGYIEIKAGTGDARRFQLTKTTYFRETNVSIVPVTKFHKKLGTCSQAMFPDFVALAERFFADRSPSDVLDGLATPPPVALPANEPAGESILAAPEPKTNA